MIIQVCKVKVIPPAKAKPLLPKELLQTVLNEGLVGLLKKNVESEVDDSLKPVEGWNIGDYASDWGPMTLKKEKLVKTERHHSFRHRYSYVGPFRYPHRALLPISDGRAWHHQASGKGGTVLIDWSGSMILPQEAILKVLENNPLATVAVYGGCGYRKGSNRVGYLKILASSNRYAVDFKSEGTGNVVDGPALKWLARQDRPRVWVSDGVVTGIGDAPANPLMLLEVARTIKRSGIRWITSLREMPKSL